MKKLQTLAVKSDTINKKIMADVKGTLSYQKKIDKNSFEVCMYPDKENDKILLKLKCQINDNLYNKIINLYNNYKKYL